jgi:hypothetical protein
LSNHTGRVDPSYPLPVAFRDQQVSGRIDGYGRRVVQRNLSGGHEIGVGARHRGDHAVDIHFADVAGPGIRNEEVARRIECDLPRAGQRSRARRAAIAREPRKPFPATIDTIPLVSIFRTMLNPTSEK